HESELRGSDPEMLAREVACSVEAAAPVPLTPEVPAKGARRGIVVGAGFGHLLRLVPASCSFQRAEAFHKPPLRSRLRRPLSMRCGPTPLTPIGHTLRQVRAGVGMVE